MAKRSSVQNTPDDSDSVKKSLSLPERTIAHIVLPHHVASATCNQDIRRQNAVLSVGMFEAVEQSAEWLPAETVAMFATFVRCQQTCTAEAIQNEIVSLKPGNVVAFYVRCQNTVFMLHMPGHVAIDGEPSADTPVIVATFPAQVNATQIYGNALDLEVTYPLQALQVRFSPLLRSAEFAHQLQLLAEDEMLHNDDSKKVSHWLVAALTDDKTETAAVDTFPPITKKVRDERIQTDDAAIFRRSPLYTATKAILHHNLSLTCGKSAGRLAYKILMLRFITHMCRPFTDAPAAAIDVDLMAQTIAKMARRMEKLCDQYAELIESDANVAKYSDSFIRVMADAKQAIADIRAKIDDQIGAMERTVSAAADLPALAELTIKADLTQRVRSLEQYFEAREWRVPFSNPRSLWRVKPVKRHYEQNEAPDIRGLDSGGGDDNSAYLHDTERYFLHHMSEAAGHEYSALTIKGYIDTYASSAKRRYQDDDKLGISRMLLTQLKLLAMLDRIACTAHPLLKEHRPCVNLLWFGELLVPLRVDMQVAYELELYFRSRHERARYHGLIESADITDDSFAVRYATESDEMKDVLQAILEMADRNVADKEREWREARDKVAALRSRRNRLNCTCPAEQGGAAAAAADDDDDDAPIVCERCRLDRAIGEATLLPYEYPMPECAVQRQAIVFELRVPEEIAYLRDALHTFNEYGATGQTPFDLDWRSYGQIVQFDRQLERVVRIGRRVSPKIERLHVDCAFDEFVVRAQFNCVLYAGKQAISQALGQERVRSICALAVEPHSPYAGLQWAVHGTTHTQNEVLATQSECPQHLSLGEYVNFGSLRADGCRLQWRKLFGMLECEALAFDQMSVVSLCLQAIWQQNQIGGCGWVRESNVDLRNDRFVMATVELLDRYVEKQRNNWAHPTKLLLAAFVTVRCAELNEDAAVFEQCSKLLRKQRHIAAEWCKKIAEAICKPASVDQEAEMENRQKLVLAAIAGCVTFFVHRSNRFFATFLEHSDISVWLGLIIVLNNNLTITNAGSASNWRMLLRLVQSIGINMESANRTAIDRNPDRSIVLDIVRTQWAGAQNCAAPTVYFDKECPQTLVVVVAIDGVRSHVTIDIVSGAFLVDNMPVSRLPAEVTSTQLFLAVFEYFAFEVQPIAPGEFVTVQKYHGCTYEFRVQAQSSVLIVEHGPNGAEAELIPPETLKSDIPHMLCTDYSHWWCKASDCIEFRSKRFADARFSTHVEYMLDMGRRRLTNTQTGRHMLDVTSASYRKIIEQLKRLEGKRYIHVFVSDARPNVAQVELVRMRLKFEVADNDERGSHLMSNEFAGMRVALQQNCGSLFGLQTGLILEPIQNIHHDEAVERPKILLMPHGAVRVSESGKHVMVDIDVCSALRKPPFHRYQIDDFMQQIRSSNSSYSAWFYLAYLHAVTSHGQIEPLLGMSGTERALQILQSGFVWSSAPYDAEASRTLGDIADLAPARKLSKDRCTQAIQWPERIPPGSCHDAFAFVVNALRVDSERLHGLFSGKAKESPDKAGDMALNQRGYLRTIQLRPNARVSAALANRPLPPTAMAIQPNVPHSDATRKIATLYHQRSFQPAQPGSVQRFLTGAPALLGVSDSANIHSLYGHTGYKTLSDLWLTLYEAARRGRFSREKFALLWTLLAHNVNDPDAILALQTVEANAPQFLDLDPPPADRFYRKNGEFDRARLKRIVRGHVKCPRNFRKAEHAAAARAYADELTSYVEKLWPCRSITYPPLSSAVDFERAAALEKINGLLTVWYDNWQLQYFLRRLDERCAAMARGTTLPHEPAPFGPSYHSATPRNLAKYEIELDSRMHENFKHFGDEWRVAQAIWSGANEPDGRFAHEWWAIYRKVTRVPGTEHLIDAGFLPRCVPSLVLPKMADASAPGQLRALVGVIALRTVHEQRAKRIALFERETKQPADHELEPHTNWRPSEHPEWLLFEIEQNLCIRPIQIEVADRMIDPPDNGAQHSVMQLNMGEGKTSVILPILAAHLADGRQLCQITVLKSLYVTNSNALRQSLGGMLARKVYQFPCRRDMPIDSYSGQLLGIYEECKRVKGVIVTLPEYRCSFQLKMYESIKKNSHAVAADLYKLNEWLHANVRNVMDESDAILHAKYQLVYTVGNQLPIDGGELRWTVAQAVLKLVPGHMRRLYQAHGADYVEFDENYLRKANLWADGGEDRADVFVPCRLLDPAIFDKLKVALITDFVEGKMNLPFAEMSPTTQKNMRALLVNKKIDAAKLDAMLKKLSKQDQYTFMILSGLLRFEVLRLILTKRWRVNYGVDPKGARKMAVPFKAKDVAAEMTEFGHADVAISFTLLSYYYAGLSDGQLFQVFQLLQKTPNADAIYEEWIKSVPAALQDPTIKSITAVNLHDRTQRDRLLFPLLRYNMHAIDFWLAQTVFPAEAKTFEQKLMSTAWDLCSEQFVHRVTGFSGTNDTQHTLPLQVRQNDLRALRGTNDHVSRTLLQDENQAYQSLPENVSGMEILAMLVERPLSVLLDAGALMLQLSNEQVARKWLAQSPRRAFDAAIFFDDHDVLQTIDRNGVLAEFDCSVYRDKLDRCLVYLDDAHTRGTDLKFPPTQRACVTLSGDMTRDKTVQACMRMRKLGKGQTIAFLASFEADIRIKETCGLSGSDHVTNSHVLEFVQHNSRQFVVEHMTHWSLAGVNYLKRWAGHRLYPAAHRDPAVLAQLYGKCVDDEFVELNDLYGDKKERTLYKIARSKCDTLTAKYEESGASGRLLDTIGSKATRLTGRVKKMAPEVKRFVHTLEDQQEKELEHEAEEERQLERPGRAAALPPTLSAAVRKFVESADVKYLESEAFVPIGSALASTFLFADFADERSAWSERLYVTRDFVAVIADQKNADAYLRPVWWVAQVHVDTRRILLCLSSFECARLMQAFSKSAVSTLFMYRPRLSRFHRDLLGESRLQVSGKPAIDEIPPDDAVQIGMFAGCTYFASEEEQAAYCGFVGLIPRRRSAELNAAFRRRLIRSNGFVDLEHRQLPSIKDCVGQCKFVKNPADLAIKIIETRHRFINADSHVASILKKGVKKPIKSAMRPRLSMSSRQLTLPAPEARPAGPAIVECAAVAAAVAAAAADAVPVQAQPPRQFMLGTVDDGFGPLEDEYLTQDEEMGSEQEDEDSE